MALPECGALELELSDGWLTVRLNQPDRRNALSAALAGELRQVLEAVKPDRAVRGITIRGNGGTFCAGGDLKGFQAALGSGDTRGAVVQLSRQAGLLFDLVSTMPQVVVMAVEGAAMAGGFGLACCGDVVLATKEARFALTETRIGLTPAQIVPHVVRRLGFARARRLLLTGESVGGEAAASMGLVDEAFDDAGALDAAVAAVRKSVLKCAPGAVAATKELLFFSESNTGAAMQMKAAQNFADCLLSDEGSEGIASFLEKRAPAWAQG